MTRGSPRKGSSAWEGVKVDDNPHATAAAVDCYVEEPLPNELQIDIDSEGDMDHVHRGLKILNQHGISARLGRVTASMSGNKHVRVVFPREVSDVERVALQACLGSDRVREMLSMVRIIKGISVSRPPTVFFEPLAKVVP